MPQRELCGTEHSRLVLGAGGNAVQIANVIPDGYSALFWQALFPPDGQLPLAGQMLLCKESKCQPQTYQFGALLASKRQGIVGFIPLPVRGAVNENDAVLHQGLCPHQLIVGSIVDDINDSGLASAALQKKNMNSNLQGSDN